MSGIKFCKECLNILVAQEKREESRLQFYCKSCDYSEYCRDPRSMEENRISVRNFVQALTEDLIHSDYCFDPTMPREKILCPNQDCRHFESVYVISREPNDKSLKKTYICPECKEKFTALYYQKLGEKLDTLAYRQTVVGEQLDIQIEDAVPNLVLIHGLYSNSYLFEQVITLLGTDFRVIAPDLRGFGFSSYTNEVKKIEDYATDIVAFLDKLKIRKCSLVGWDLGCLVALKLVASRPANLNVEKLVLVNPIPLTGKTYRINEETDMEELEWPEKYEDLLSHPQYITLNQAFFKRNKKVLSQYIEKEVLPPFDEDHKEMYDTYVEHFHIQPKGYDHVMKALYDFKFTDEEKDNIQIETRIFTGGNDTKCPKPEITEYKNTLGDNCVVVDFPDAGHNIILSEPDEFVNQIKEFCSNDGL